MKAILLGLSLLLCGAVNTEAAAERPPMKAQRANTNVENTLTLPESVKGNWFGEDGSNKWTYGVYDSVTIMDNRIYTNLNVRQKGKRIELTVREKGGEETVSLTLEPRKDGGCRIKKEGEKKRNYTRESRASKTPDNEPDFERFMTRDTATLQGYLDGYGPEAGFASGMVYLRDRFSDEYTPTVIEIAPDGSFSGKLPLNHPIEDYMKVGEKWIPFYVEPGQTLTLYVSPEAWKAEESDEKSVEYMGPTASIAYLSRQFNELVSYDLDRIRDAEKLPMPDEFRASMRSTTERWDKAVDSLARACPEARKAIHLMGNKVALQKGRIMLTYLFRKGLERTMDDKERAKVKSALRAEENFDLFRKMPLDDEAALVEYRLNDIIEPIEDVVHLYGQTLHNTMPDTVIYNYPEVSFPDFLVAEGVTLTAEEETLRQELDKRAGTSDTIVGGFKDENMPEEVKRYTTGLGTLESKHLEAFVKYMDKYGYYISYTEEGERQLRFNMAKETLQDQDSTMRALYGSSDPLLWQIQKLRRDDFYIGYMESPKYARQLTDLLIASLSDPTARETAESFYDKAYPKAAPGTYRLPEGKATEVFRNLVGKYKGKVVFVDFWATWCGPCRKGIESTAELRRKYRNHPEFQFVYVTAQDESPEKDYNAYVEKHLKGEECYRVPATDYHYLRQLFRFNGIPHYVLMEKDGSISEADINAHNIGEYLERRFGNASANH